MRKNENSQNILYTGILNAASIDEISDVLVRTLDSFHFSSKDAVKMRLAAESVLNIWAEELGENTQCRLMQRQRFGKASLFLQADGKSVDPTRYQDDLLLSVSSNPNLVTALGLPAEYCYVGGSNELKLQLPKKENSPIRKVIFAMLAALVFGFFTRSVFPGTASVITSALLMPLMNTITKMLSLIAGPLIFLSVVSGIFGVGDATSFGKIGGTLVKRLLIMTFVLTVLLWLSLSWMFPATLSGGMEGENTFSKLLDMILDIIPKDIITPFQTGNALQIIFLAGCVGVGGIVLGDTVPETVKIVNQINAIVQKLMMGISNILPVYVFLSISGLIISSNTQELSQIIVPMLLIVGLHLVTAVIYGLYAALKTGTPVGYLFRSQIQTFLVALSTASSAASFGLNVECCEKKLRIDSKLVRFGIPFGQVLFKPGGAIVFVVLSLYMAKYYNIPMTPTWVATMLIIVSILAVASPPIPGGGISAILVLYTQLGIPTSCLAISTTILMFSDYTITANDLVCLQHELLIIAKKLGLLQSET